MSSAPQALGFSTHVTDKLCYKLTTHKKIYDDQVKMLEDPIALLKAQAAAEPENSERENCLEKAIAGCEATLRMIKASITVMEHDIKVLCSQVDGNQLSVTFVCANLVGFRLASPGWPSGVAWCG